MSDFGEPDSFDDDIWDDSETNTGSDGAAESRNGEGDSRIGDHRGAFGEFGGSGTGGLLDRTFRERIVLVGVTRGGQTAMDTEASLDELEALVDTAGADVLDRIVQRLDRPDPATFVGRGKVDEIADASLAIDSDTVVFDDELTPAQQYNLERILQRSALDRTAVILDIFAQHATSAEGKAQVELAQLRYRLPRLRGKKNFSQQAGGIGTRGPGETQLEVDRRRLLRRMHKLERDLARITERRGNQRKARHRSPFKTVTIVGYTNAGKSSLLRRLTGADVRVENRLFATVDPTTRRLQLPGGEQILLTDTVGFVKKLPHQLVEAFRSTLEVAGSADLLVHVVDASSADPDSQIRAVAEVLAEIEAAEVPQLLVFNKADASDAAEWLVQANPGSVAVSALTGEGVDELLRAIGERLREMTDLYELFIPWSRGDALASVHREGEVVVEISEDAGMRIRARLEGPSARRLSAFIVGSVDGATPDPLPAPAWTDIDTEARTSGPGFGATVTTVRAQEDQVREGRAVGIQLPPYPYDRLDELLAVADAHEGGVIDLSIGTPCDPPPDAVIEALGHSGAERGYPPSIGSPALRASAAGWLNRLVGTDLGPNDIRATIGTKEFVAGLPHWLRLRDPSRDTVLYPAISYPTYEMGATLAGCRAVPVPVDDQWRIDLDAIDPADAARALCLWVNTPGNPAGGLDDLETAARWGRDNDVLVCSDECYIEFTWDGPPRSILQHGRSGLLAVHSLSKRSNLAGTRSGFYAGDPDLVHYLGELRKHAGFMMPGPVQAASVVAYDDDAHVEVQRGRYRRRLELMARVAALFGSDAALPAGGFYLWAPAPGGDAWAFTRKLAEEAGVLVSPGEFYGARGADHVRIAVVQPDERIALAVSRVGLSLD